MYSILFWYNIVFVQFSNDHACSFVLEFSFGSHQIMSSYKYGITCACVICFWDFVFTEYFICSRFYYFVKSYSYFL